MLVEPTAQTRAELAQAVSSEFGGISVALADDALTRSPDLVIEHARPRDAEGRLINGRELGLWTSPGDYGDTRGVFTPDWWKLKGSQYGVLKSWRVTPEGSFVDGVRISSLTPEDLDISGHHSIRLRIEVKPDALHPGGVNIFGRGFGNYDQDIVLRLTTEP